MADLPSAFWGGYIAVITIVSFIAFVWLIVDVYFSRGGDRELAGKVWDHDLKEGSAPAPIWWFWLLFSLLIVSVIYLMLYPGLGRFEGALRWSQGGELAAARTDYAETFGAERARIAAAAIDDLAGEPAAVAAGARIYAVHCAACHGPAAEGQARLFPNLVDGHWQWGGSADAVARTIRSGRTAVMPGLGAALNDDGVAAVADYVIALAEGRADNEAFAAARTQFAQFCSACHGADATGNALLGAPDLTTGVYTYGGDYDAIRQTIASGRQGQMPGFGQRLDDTQINLLAAWLRSSAAEAD